MKHTNRAKSNTSSVQPHSTRLAIRYQAADNAKLAILRQFPQIFIQANTSGLTTNVYAKVISEEYQRDNA